MVPLVRPLQSICQAALDKWLPLGAASICLVVGCSPNLPTRQSRTEASSSAKTTSPEFMADPCEPLNRGLWALNEGVLLGVIQPTSRVYRAAVPMPVRQSIKDFTRNITYPGRMVNHCLEGRWTGASDESLRFICNTTAGVGGLFDVASRWNIPKSEANFAQTFSHWGWNSNRYVVLPFFGPSDESHALGLALDEASQPWNYQLPYTIASYGSTYNGVTDQVEQGAQFIRSEADSYADAKYAWSYVSKNASPDWQSDLAKDLPTLQTMGVALIKCKDPKFIERGREMSVRLTSTGRVMRFNCWLQPTAAPLVYVAPGLGTHRLSETTLTLAENLYKNGYSVVTTTGVFHPEFMEHASTSALPGYPPADCHDLWVELTEIDRTLAKKYPGKFLKKAIVSFSMGGFQSLYFAAHEKKEKSGLLVFDRYVALNPPVHLNHGYVAVDNFYDAPLAWQADDRQKRINNSLHKVAKLSSLPASLGGIPPFDATESKFLIGFSFRLTLRDAIYSSQRRHSMGLLQTPLSPWRRDASYREIFNISYHDYFQKFAIPYYQSRGIGSGEFNREISLMTHEQALRAQSKVRVIMNRNDFLLNPQDAAWLESTFGPSRVKVFPDGGHLGNLANPQVQDAVIAALVGLK